jgi:hypothetical protein
MVRRNKRAALNAGRTRLSAFNGHWSRASDRGRQAAQPHPAG